MKWITSCLNPSSTMSGIEAPKSTYISGHLWKPYIWLHLSQKGYYSDIYGPRSKSANVKYPNLLKFYCLISIGEYSCDKSIFKNTNNVVHKCLQWSLWFRLLKNVHGKSLQWSHNERDSVSNTSPAVYSGADHRKHQSSTSLAFVKGFHRWPVNSPHKGQ